ncbi:cyclic nucleotide-binding domain-containing protein [Azospirillum sp. B506]|uniref:cyclic nucleotide-binding domain-containing protein n=1 Tax=Azospirillum sp. B506 TaxID=137721 RepID=UPI001FCCBBD7|nr:cyclic nucleotide-binding domain-containing protein [Azospirillum sp. B506]
MSRAPLLSGFSDENIRQLASIMDGPIRIPQGRLLFEEGAPGDTLYFILSGGFEVLKRDGGGSALHRLALLTAGQSIGEVSLLDSGPRSGAVRAVEDSEVVAVPIARLREQPDPHLGIDSRLKINMAYELAARLRRTNEVTVETLRRQLSEAESRVEMSKFIYRLLVGLCFYMFALGVTTALSKVVPDTSLISLPILVGFAFGVWRTVKTSPWPPSTYGFTLENWRGNALEGAVLFIPVALLVVLLKWIGVTFIPALQGAAVFDFPRSTGLFGGEDLLNGSAFGAFTPIQETIARGTQASFQLFLTSKHKTLEAIVLSNMLFSATHLHVSIILALAVFPFGLYWGWIFARQGSLVGSSVSHAILGVFGLMIVGIPVF